MTPPADEDEATNGNRGSKRDSLFLLANIRREGGAVIGRIRIRNLSGTGLMADCETRVADGDRLTVDLRGIGEVSGVVRWTSGDRIGMEFDRQIDPQAARQSVGKGNNDLPGYLRPIISPKPGFRR